MKPEQQSRKKKAAARRPRPAKARPARPLTLDERLLKLEATADKTLRATVRAAVENSKGMEGHREWLEALEKKYTRMVAEGKGFIDNQAQALEDEFAAGLPRAMRAHGIVIAAADVLRRIQRAPNCLEYDFVAPNGEVVLVGEVKARLRVKDVALMSGRLRAFRRDYPEYAGLKLHGVVAGAVVDDAALALAKEEGFFVMRLDGAGVHPALGKKFTPAAY